MSTVTVIANNERYVLDKDFLSNQSGLLNTVICYSNPDIIHLDQLLPGSNTQYFPHLLSLWEGRSIEFVFSNNFLNYIHYKKFELDMMSQRQLNLIEDGFFKVRINAVPLQNKEFATSIVTDFGGNIQSIPFSIDALNFVFGCQTLVSKVSVGTKNQPIKVEFTDNLIPFIGPEVLDQDATRYVILDSLFKIIGDYKLYGKEPTKASTYTGIWDYLKSFIM